MNLGTPIAVGNTAKIYLFENKIVKVFNDNLSDTESIHEAYKQEYAYSCGLSVPKVLDVIKLEDKQAIVMEYIKGKTIGDIISSNREQAENYIDICVRIQHEIHQNEAPSIEHMSEKLSRQISNAPGLGSKVKSELIDKLNSMTFEQRLCHGDYHPFNLIKSDNEITIIDWIDSSAGDFRADIYRTYLLFSLVSIKLAEMYVRIYCVKYSLSKDEIFQWAPIIAAARLSEGVPSENSDRLIKIVNYYCCRN